MDRDIPHDVHPLQPVRERLSLVVELPSASHLRLFVYDVSGREVSRLADADLNAGHHAFPLQLAASGIYFARAAVVSARERIVRTARVALLR